MESKENNVLQKIIVKKKAVFPLKNLRITIDKNKINDSDYLMKYTSKFDINPKMNFELFKKKINYDFLNKYKYTLNYNDAKSLNCFQIKKEEDLKNQIEKKLEKFNIKNKIDMNYFAKNKLIDLLLYILSVDTDIPIDYNKMNEIKQKIKSYKSEYNLIFKCPINFGNIELKYYFYLDLFCDYFLFDHDLKEKQQTPLLKQKHIFFQNIDIDSNEVECDLTGFEHRKKDLLEYIDNNDNKESKIQNFIEKEKVNQFNYDGNNSEIQCEIKKYQKKLKKNS